MSKEPDPPETTDDLQFETAEPAVIDYARPMATAPTCVACHRPIVSTYFAVRDKMLCPTCACMWTRHLPALARPEFSRPV